ncbi:MAG: hypothetical protein NTW87_27930 [Planctomycetota bacterium]|nr:hypothetical protein [Planctomycetota bacterium]
MLDRRKFLGVACGLGLAALILPRVNSAGPARARGRLLSECDGALAELAIQYVPDAAPIAATVYREFLRQLPRDVTVYVLWPASR